MTWRDEWVKAWRDEFDPEPAPLPPVETVQIDETHVWPDGFMRQFRAAGNA